MQRISFSMASFEQSVAESLIKSSRKSLSLKRCFVALVCIVLSMSANVSEICAQDNTSSPEFQDKISATLDRWICIPKYNAEGIDSYMNNYAALLDSLDIAVTMPSSFSITSEDEVGRPFFFSPNPDFVTKYFHSVDIYSAMGPILESEAKDALFAYPLIELESPIRKMESELIVSNGNDDLDITPMIKRITGEEAQKLSNVDEVILYDYEIAKPVIGKYNHAIGIVLRKKGHYPMLLRIFLNDEGLGKRDEYVKLLLDNVRYGDNPVPECVEKEGLEPIEFPLKKIECKGLHKH